MTNGRGNSHDKRPAIVYDGLVTRYENPIAFAVFMKTVLSIQSHVALGCVGNRAATFALQRLGCEVIAVNTVQFSNHTGYGAWRGEVFSPEHITDVLIGVAERGVLPQCHAVLSGYMGDAALGQAVLNAAAQVKAANPRAVYCCDPVMGDVGRGVFVRPGIPEFMRERAIPAADVVTPNQFELELLTGTVVTTLEDAVMAAASLRARGPKAVLVTSLTRANAPADMIEMLVDTADGSWLVATPRLPIDPSPNGAGDAVAALFLAHYLRTFDPAKALERSAAGIYAIFLATRRYRTRELQMVAAQEEFVQPTHLFPAERVR
jgi:pyridoxine kinase